MRVKDKPLQAPSLLELSANVVARDNGRLLYEECSQDPSSSSPAANFSLRNPVVELPLTVADVVVKHVCRNLRNESASADSVAENLRPFLDGERQPLERLDLSGLNILDRTLGSLLAAQQSTLTSLDLSHIRLKQLIPFFMDIRSTEVCSILTDLKVQFLKLSTLTMTNCDLLRIPHFNPTSLELVGSLPHFVEFCPNIQHLYLQQGLLNNIKDETADEFLFRIFKTLKSLRTLDLSEWNSPDHLHILENAPYLTTLILYDVQNLESCIPMISSRKNLKCLDLSQSDRVTGQYSKPVTCLHTLVTKLPNLECLDISGTNLTSDISDDDRPYEGIDFVPSYIAGLSFLSQPLKFLGIFNCEIGSHFGNIPAERIYCDHSEDQIILAIEAYMSRPKMMKTVLDKSRQLYRYETGLNRHVDALHLILKVLSSHRTNGGLQIAGHNAMFHILPEVEMNRDTKKAVLCELLYAMENHMNEQEMVRICCISLGLFITPEDFLLNYIQIAKLLMRVLETHGSYFSTQLIVLKFLVYTAPHLDQNYKIHLGLIGIKIILELIRRKLAANVCDTVLKMCWGLLCTMTDETPSNCDRFLKADGMKLFSQCILRFLNDDTLVVNMLILVGNVAEVKCLRSQLMDIDYLNIYWKLLFMYPNFNNGFEICYSSAYVLAHLVSEGEAAWRGVRISRRAVMDKIIAAIGAWDLSTKILFQYHSLKPILGLLPVLRSPASQHWGVWALANLTSINPEKYCRYIDAEGGEKLVRNLVYDTRVSARISTLARVVLANMDTWRNPGAITTSAILDETIMPGRQNSNPYLKKVSRIMMRFLPALLPVSTLFIASLYVGSYERAIRSNYMLRLEDILFMFIK